MSTSAPAFAIPGTVQRETKRQPEPEIDNRQEQSIANLAYTLWQQRGCQDGSSEEDWLEAEKLIGVGQQQN